MFSYIVLFTKTHSTTSSRQAVSRAHRKEFVVPLLTVLLFLLVCFVIGVGITLYRRYRNRGGFEQPISIEDRDCDEDQLLRDVPYPVIENLALKLNPRGLNNWMRLA
ncbi:hypothetical protein QZH41_016694, partial [Actinostola sp. cb2023]